MFKGYKVETKIVKNNKTSHTNDSTENLSDQDYVQLVRETAPKVAKWIAIGVAGYVALDTLRQVIVNAAPHN